MSGPPAGWPNHLRRAGLLSAMLEVELAGWTATWTATVISIVMTTDALHIDEMKREQAAVPSTYYSISKIKTEVRIAERGR